MSNGEQSFQSGQPLRC